MIIVKLHPNIGDTKGDVVRFARATDWEIDDSGPLPILNLTRPTSAPACPDCGEAVEVVAAIPWQTVQMVYQHDALEPSI